jgi:hypothetical protein
MTTVGSKQRTLGEQHVNGFFDRFKEGVNPSKPAGSSSAGLMGVVMSCFNENGWKYRQPEAENLRQFGFSGKHANFEGAILVEEDAEDIVVLFRAPTKVPECRRLAMAELLARANFGMKFGAIEMDYQNGEVRFKCAATVREGQLSPQMVHFMVGLSLATLAGFYPALMGVCFGNELPSDALDAARAPQAKQRSGD